MLYIILFINGFSKTFPAAFIKLIGLNFDTSVEFSLSGFLMGIIFTFLHFFGKHSFLKYSLYSVYVCMYVRMYVCMYVCMYVLMYVFFF